MSDLAKFRIEVDAVGQGSMQINDQDVPQGLVGWGVQSRLGQPPLVTLNMVGGGVVIEGEGIVHVQSSAAHGPTIEEFLGGIDPAALDQAVLAGYGYGDGSPMEIALRILQKWAAGDVPPA